MTAIATRAADSRRRVDVSHHHPEVCRVSGGGWGWTCSCGASAPRRPLTPNNWRRALIEALNHSSQLAA